MNKIFISTSSFAEFDSYPLTELKKHKLQVTLNPHERKLSKPEITHILESKKYVGLIAGTEILDADVLSSASDLKVISRVGVGMDAIDLNKAKEESIIVYNTPGVLTDAVSELTLGLMLSVLRKIALHDRSLRSGVWKKQMGVLLKGKTVGIVGLGKMGKRVAQLVKAFGCDVIFYDIAPKKVRGMQQLTLNQVIRRADILSFHCSTKDELISKKEIAVMKRGVCIINASRGGVLNEKALYTGLKSGQVGGAGLDVFASEPYSGNLLQLDNVVCTSHIGSYAQEARVDMERLAVKNMIKGLKKAGII